MATPLLTLPGGQTALPGPNPIPFQGAPLPPRGGTAQPYNWTPAEAATAGLGWVPPSHPAFGTPGFVGPQGPGAVAGGPPAPAPAPFPGASTPSTPPTATTTTTPQGTPPAGGAGTPPTVQTSIRDFLIGRLNQPDPTLQDPTLAPALQAFRDQQQRGTERARETLASVAGLTGTRDTGGFGTALTGLEQRRGEAEGGFAGNLLRDELIRRRQEQLAAGGLATGLVEGEERLGLAERLQGAELDLRRLLGERELGIRERGVEGQIGLGGQDIGLRRELGRGQLGLGLLGLLLDESLGRDRLGFDIGQAEAGLNTQALLSLLGYL